MTCKDCIHYCVCKDMWADENWTDEAPAEIRKMFSPQGCENFTAAVDLAPVKHGEWVDLNIAEWQCSECKYRVERWNNTPYCPECGARMDGGKK